MGQSSNDVFPTAIHLAALEQRDDLLPALDRLAQSLEAKAEEFDDRQDRPHPPQDAVPIRSARSSPATPPRPQGIARIEATLGLGDPARRHRRRHRPQHPPRVRRARPLQAARETGLDHPRRRATVRGPGDARRPGRGVGGDERRGQPDQDRERHPLARLGPACRASARSRCPSSSRAARSCPARSTRSSPRSSRGGRQVIGNDATITVGGLQGHFEMNVFVPVIARNLLDSIRCSPPPRASSPRSASTASRPTARPASATPSSRSPPRPRSTRTSATTRRRDRQGSRRLGRSLREVAREAGVDEETLDKALDYRAMAEPHAKPASLDISG